MKKAFILIGVFLFGYSITWVAEANFEKAKFDPEFQKYSDTLMKPANTFFRVDKRINAKCNVIKGMDVIEKLKK